LREELEAAIAIKEEEFDQWNQLSDEQKKYLTSKVLEHVPKSGPFKDVLLVAAGVVTSLTATAIWTLLGNPGKEQLLEQWQAIWPFKG
jgi:hypothetical protein